MLETIINVISFFLTYMCLYQRDKLLNNNNTVNIIDVFRHTYYTYGDYPALKVKRNKKWNTITYKKYYEQCCIFSKSLQTVGVYDIILIAGNNGSEWLYAHWGSMMCNVKPVATYPLCSGKICNNVAIDCNPELLVVEDENQLQKFNKYLSSKNRLKTIVYYGILNDDTIQKLLLKYTVYSWDEFMKLSNKTTSGTYTSVLSNIATIAYTYDTIDDIVRGCMITHNNIMQSTQSVLTKLNSHHMPITKCSERFVSYIPTCNIAVQILDVYIPITIVGTVWIGDTENIETTLQGALLTANPTIFPTASKIWEIIMEKIEMYRSKLPEFTKRLLSKNNMEKIKKKMVTKEMGLTKCKYLITTGSFISQTTLDYFNNMNMELFNTYSMSQATGPIAISTKTSFKHGSVGKVMDNMNVKIVNGEILLKGPSIFVGYYNNYDETVKISTNGWFRTGDLGFIDDNGYLFITGCSKDIITMKDGTEVLVVPIEIKIRSKIPLVDQVIVIGNNRKYLSILLTLKCIPNLKNPKELLLSKDIKYILKKMRSKSKTAEDALKDSKINRYLEINIDNINRTLPAKHRIKNWMVVPSIFSITCGEHTPTMKLRRTYINKKYKDYIDDMY